METDFVAILRSYERKNRRVLTSKVLQEMELEFNGCVMNHFVYHQQTHSVAEYENTFIEVKRWAETLNGARFSENLVVDIFIQGLKEEIPKAVELWSPMNLQRAIVLAKWQEKNIADEVFDEKPQRGSVSNSAVLNAIPIEFSSKNNDEQLFDEKSKRVPLGDCQQCEDLFETANISEHEKDNEGIEEISKTSRNCISFEKIVQGTEFKPEEKKAEDVLFSPIVTADLSMLKSQPVIQGSSQGLLITRPSNGDMKRQFPITLSGILLRKRVHVILVFDPGGC